MTLEIRTKQEQTFTPFFPFYSDLFNFVLISTVYFRFKKNPFKHHNHVIPDAHTVRRNVTNKERHIRKYPALNLFHPRF